MKNLILIFSMLFSTWGYSQCEISGKTTLHIGETAVYSINNELAQCKQCHQWTSSANTKITGDNRLNSVAISAESTGNALLSLQYLSPYGLIKCSKDITILPASNSQHQSVIDNDCDIDLTNFREVKTDANTLAFFPTTNQDLGYNWEVHYSNGQTTTSSEKVPQFTFSKENPIVKVQVKVLSKICYKKFTKSYDASFWINF